MEGGEADPLMLHGLKVAIEIARQRCVEVAVRDDMARTN